MATLGIGRAINKVTSGTWLKSVSLILVGSMAATMATQWLRNNVFDVAMTGGDALYAVALSVATLAIAPASLANPLSLGMAASGGQTLLRDFNVV